MKRRKAMLKTSADRKNSLVNDLPVLKSAQGEKGITPVSRFVRFGSYIAEYGRAIAEELLMSKDPPTAIFAASDYVALGVLNAVQNLGISIPKDLSLVGFDDMPFAALLSPPLATVRQPIREMGEAGINFLLQLIKGEMEEMPVLRLPVQFIARSSVLAVLRGSGSEDGRYERGDPQDHPSNALSES